MLELFRLVIKNVLEAIKDCFVNAIYSLLNRLNVFSYRVLVSSKHDLPVLRPAFSVVYNITHRFLVSRKQSQDALLCGINIEPKRKILYPAIAFLVGAQLMAYQIIVLAYPGFSFSSTGNSDSKTRREITSLRTANSKHFLNLNGTKTALIYAAPVHYKNENGEWKDIDTDISSDRKIDGAPYEATFENSPAYRLSYKGISIRIALKTDDSKQSLQSSNKSISFINFSNLESPISLTDEETTGTTAESITGKSQGLVKNIGGEKRVASITEETSSAKSTEEATEETSFIKTSKTTIEEIDDTSPTASNKEEAELQKDPVSIEKPAIDVADDSTSTDDSIIEDSAENPIDDPVLEDYYEDRPIFRSSISRNEIRYENVYEDTDLLLSAKPYSVEKWLILRSKAAPDTFEFEIETSKAPKLSDDHLEWGEVASLDCYAVDASGAIGKVDFSYSPNGKSGGIVTIKVDESFLSSASYPIRIDPTITLNPSFDNYVNEYEPDTVHRTESSCLVGKTSTSLNRMLLWFDMSSLTGKSINSAELSLFENGAGRAGRRFKLFRIAEPWDTTYVTWNNRDDGIEWTDPGGTYAGGKIGDRYTSVLIDGAEAVFDMTNVAQKWALGTLNNYGLLFKAARETNNRNNCGFYMSEQGGAYQPKIEIDYIEIPDAPTGLIQYEADHSTIVPVGGTTDDGVATNLYFDMSMSSPNATDMLTPKVEIRPVGIAFTGIETHAGSPVSYDGSPVTGSVAISGLQAGGSYHWQSWISNVSGDGPATSYGGNSDPDDIDIMIGSSISLTIDSTYNRDGTPSLNSVDFGSVSPEESPFFVHKDKDKHAVQLSIVSDSTWSLNAQADGNLIDESTGNKISIRRLKWRNHSSSDSWVSFQTTPYTILFEQAPTSGTTLRHDYKLGIGWKRHPGSYGTTLTYTLTSP